MEWNGFIALLWKISHNSEPCALGYDPRPGSMSPPYPTHTTLTFPASHTPYTRYANNLPRATLIFDEFSLQRTGFQGKESALPPPTIQITPTTVGITPQGQGPPRTPWYCYK